MNYTLPKNMEDPIRLALRNMSIRSAQRRRQVIRALLRS